MQNHIQSKKFEYGKVIVISTSHLVHDIFSSFLAPILPLIIDKLGISLSQAGLLSLSQRLPSIMNPFIGIWADRGKFKYFLVVSPVLTATVMSLLGLAPSYIFVLLLLVIAGISATLYHVPAPPLVKDVSGPYAGRGMSFFMLGGELARTIGPVTILGAVSLWGLEGTYRLIPFSMLASLILFFQIRKIDIKSTKTKKHLDSRVSVKETLQRNSRFFTFIIGFLFLRGLMKASLTTFLPVYLTRGGETLWLAGISLSVLQFSGAGGTLFGGIISDKIGRRKTLIIASLFSPAFLLLFIYMHSFYNIIALVFLGIFLFAPGPVMLAFVQDIKTDRPAFLNGIYMAINFVISALCIFFSGFLSDHLGMDLTYKISALVAFAAVLFLYYMPDHHNENKA